jgi:hypothetical protein
MIVPESPWSSKHLFPLASPPESQHDNLSRSRSFAEVEFEYPSGGEMNYCMFAKGQYGDRFSQLKITV